MPHRQDHHVRQKHHQALKQHGERRLLPPALGTLDVFVGGPYWKVVDSSMDAVNTVRKAITPWLIRWMCWSHLEGEESDLGEG